MRTLKLDTLSFIASPNEKKFILLRSEKADDPEFLETFAIPKVLNRNEAYKIPGVWGTLGYANNDPIDWEGRLECSNEGNDDFEPNSTVEDEVKLLRSETYGLDGSTLQDRPYTVTESLMSVRLEFDPSELPSPLWAETLQGYWAGGGYIFFSFNVAQRTTQYERGDDPMHSMSFVKGYDAYGHPLGELSVGLPRGSSPQSGGPGNYLATYGESEFIYKDIDDGQYMVDRVKRSVSYDATKPAGGTSVFAFKDGIFDSQATLDVIGCSLNFYDGDAFDGLPYGEIGDFGAVVRSETLILTEDIVTDAYGGTPVLLEQSPSWPSDYPTEFQNLYPNQGGYLYKTANNEYPVTGWYAPSEKIKYDVQEGSIQDPVGLMVESKDVFDNLSSIEYDDYQMLPVKATDALGLETLAEYDYRVMQADKVTDSNENISVFDFSPLGLLKATAVIGKGTQGDYKSSSGGFYDKYAPSVEMEYDFFAFQNEGNPVWVKTIQREQHYQDEENSPTIAKIEYSDGFGRLLQTRAQAEDVIFGNQTFGSSGLSENQDAQNAPAVGVERDSQDPLNVVVSGWQIYNNKGEVVEQYEPFYDKGFDYTLPHLSTTGGTIPPQLGVKIKMFYDPLGRVIKTVNPDNSEQRVIYGIPDALDTPDSFTPTSWEQYTYDANDLAPLTNPNNNNVPSSHFYTPKSALMDALGRTVQTTEHKSHYNDDTSQYENVVMKYFYDIRGNLLEVKDPYNRTVFEHIYDFRPPQKDENGEQQPLPPLWTKHIDSGISTVFFDAASRPVEVNDAKGAFTLNSYDDGSRPILLWAKDKSSEDVTLRQVMEYGDDAGLSNPENNNLKGQLYKHYDEAGLVEIPEYDFKGNVLTNKRQCISDTELMSVFDGPPTNWEVNCYRVDWTGIPNILDVKVFETNSEYDALNRVTKVTYPEDTNSNRKTGIPKYNCAGALEKVEFDGTDYVKHIAYNAKGQRLLIAFGNSVMTRYVYDNKTFRLKRLKSEEYTLTDWEFSPSAGTVKQDHAYINDFIGNIVEINDESPNCGVGGTGSLAREFEYDPLYRLIEADGRENSPSTTFPWWDDSYRSTDNSLTTAYTQHYAYDKLGNIQKLQHIGDNNFTRNFNYSSPSNKLDSINVGVNICSYQYDNSGNQTQENSNRFFEWDFANNMRCFYNQAGTAEPTIYAQYLYDSAGNRVKKIVRTQGGDYESISYIDGAFEYKTNGTDEQTLTHIMDDTSRIAMIRVGDDFGDTTPAIKYNLEDHLGSSSILLENNGILINKEEYYPFGETSFGSYAKKRYRYSGKEKDQESGLYYYGARYYMAMGCRFIGIDPHSFNYENLSPYSYVANNPILYVDPDGKDIEVGKKKAEKEKVDVPEPETKMVVRDDLDEDEINVHDSSNYKKVVTNQDEIDKAVEYNREVEKHNAKIRKHNAEIDAKIALFEDLGFSFDYNAEKGTLENAKLDEGGQLEANSTADYLYRSINDSKTYKLKTNRIPAQQITTRKKGEKGPLFTPNAFAFRGKNSGAISKKALANPNKENLQKILAADLAEFVDGADSTQVAFRLFYGIESSHYKSKIGINRDGLKFDLWTKTTRGNVPNSIVKGDPKRNLVR